MGIEFREVNFSYSKKDLNETLKDINIVVNDNDFISILGHTGSGKSTLIQHINGLILPSSGTVNVNGNIITSKQRKNPRMRDLRKNVGFVFQFPEYQLFEETVLKDIMFGPINFGFSEEEAKSNAIKYAKLLGIEDLLDKSPFELSGGQMRRVSIAGVLSYEPDIILLDEPTRGLDPQGEIDIMNFFSLLNKEYNKTIVMITHDMNIAYKFSNRLIVLKSAEVVFDGDKHTLFSNNEYTNYHLRKPLILNTIDRINNELNLSISYNATSIEELIEELRGELYEF